MVLLKYQSFINFATRMLVCSLAVLQLFFRFFSSIFCVYSLIALVFLSNHLRSSAVLLPPVAIFTIPVVLQNCSIQGIKLMQKNLRKVLLEGNHSHALFISAVFVKKLRIRRMRSCSLLYAGVVPNHTIGNACHGVLITYFFSYIIFFPSDIGMGPLSNN